MFSAVLTAFVVPKIQDLGLNPALESVYYQNQSLQILAQISQQIALIGTQIPLNVTQPPPYPIFHPSASDRRVNVFWLMSLVCSLSASLLATVVQQWTRSYLRVYQRSKKPLKTARIQTFLSEGLELMPMMAEAAPGLIHISVFLFFAGLADAILKISTIVGVTIVVPIIICGFAYLYSVVAPLTDPQSSYRSPFFRLIWYILRNRFRRTFEKMEARQEQHAMEKTKEREVRDVRAVQWLINNIDGSKEMDTFVLAIPGSFNEEYGQQVWKEVVTSQGKFPPDVRDAQLTLPDDVHVTPRLGPSSPPGGTTVDDLCRCVRYFFESYNTEGDTTNREARRRRMQGCIETAASLIFCTGIRPERFGEVGEVLSELGRTERINDVSTIKANPSFALRWTCLSLVTVRQMVMDGRNRVWESAGFAVSGIARFQLGYGDPDAAAFDRAQRIDGYLRTAWEHVEDLYRAFEPWGLNKTREEIMDILRNLEIPISELERIEIEADGIEAVDWRISLLQDAMDDATHQLTRLLLGESSNQLKPSSSTPAAEAFHSQLPGSTPVTPQFIFPGQQLQGLFTLRRGLRDILEDRNPGKHAEIVESLESIDDIPVPLRRLKGLTTRQLWRLQDLRDGGGLGFTIELFFLALRRLSSASSSSELKQDLYTGTFNVITSGWEKSKDSSGTQRILLNILCDLIIQGRGIFSDFSYPGYIVHMLLELVGHMIDGHGTDHTLINSAIEELQNVNFRDCMDRGLRDEASEVDILITRCSITVSGTPSPPLVAPSPHRETLKLHTCDTVLPRYWRCRHLIFERKKIQFPLHNIFTHTWGMSRYIIMFPLLIRRAKEGCRGVILQITANESPLCAFLQLHERAPRVQHTTSCTPVLSP